MVSSFILVLQYVMPLLLPLLLYFFLFHKRQRSPPLTKTQLKLPPSPPKLPIIGNLHQLGKLPHRTLRSLSQKHGDIMLLHMGPTPTLVVSSAELASQVMKTHDLGLCSRPKWRFFTKILNNGKDVISAPYGDYWRHMRSICVFHLLSNQRVQSYKCVRDQEVALMVNNINQIVLSSPTSSALINMRDVFVSLTYALVSRVVLGRKYKRENGVDFEELLKEMAELAGKFSVGDFLPWLSWIDWVNGVSARVDKLTKTFDSFFETILLEHSACKKSVDGARNFVEILLDLQNGGDIKEHMHIDRDSIKGLLLDMFAAGIDTTSTVLEWMMSEILINPSVMEKLQKEVREVGQGKEAIVEDDLKSMVYLKAVIQETLRLHTPVPLLVPRESIQDVKINGYHIARGTLIFTNAWAIGQDTRHWDEPENFYPERFLNSSNELVTKAHDFSMIPFGSGRRSCPGELFAVTSIELTMANLLLQFKWGLPFGQENETFDMKENPGITTRRATPLFALAAPVIE